MRLVTGEWPRQGVTFDTQRGTILLSADMLARADATGDDYEIRRTIARGLPDAGAHVHRREKLRGGGVLLHWRLVHVIEAPLRLERR